MRAPTGLLAAQAVLGLAIVLVLALVVVQSLGLRGDLEEARGEIAALRTQVEGMERGVPISELALRLGDLENRIRDWVVAFSDEVPSDGGGAGGAGSAVVLERIDEIRDELRDLNRRLEQICEGVPVC